MTVSDLTKTIVSAHLEGNSRADILELLAADGVKQPEKAIEKALKELSAITGTSDQDKAWYKGALRELYKRNMEISDLKSAHHVLKDMMTLDNMYIGAKREANLSAVRNMKALKPPRKAKAPAKAKPKAKATAKRPGRS